MLNNEIINSSDNKLETKQIKIIDIDKIDD